MAKALKSNVLLGYPDEAVAEATDFRTSKLGGHPDWIEGRPGQRPSCELCSSTLILVTQIYAPLQSFSLERTLYVFACLQPSCQNSSQSWKCLRGQLSYKSSMATTTTTQPNLSSSTFKATDWTEDADDWGSDQEEDIANGNCMEKLTLSESSSSSSSLAVASAAAADNKNAAASVLEMASAEIETESGSEIVATESPDKETLDMMASNTQIPQLLFGRSNNADVDCSGLVFEPFYIAVDEESTDEVLSDRERQLLVEYQKQERISDEKVNNANDKSVASGDDGYEKVLPKHGDALFHKMLSVIKRNPGQILRYSRDSGHKPLVLRKTGVQPTTCKSCRGPLICELQLLPSIIPALNVSGNPEVRVEFGTALIYTCLSSCHTPHYVEEHIVVQSESM